MALVLMGVAIPAGSFTMGSPESEVDRDIDEARHEVTLTRAFWMGRTEVSQGLYQEVMGSNPSRDAGCGADCPVNNLSWFKAAAFANALSEREGRAPCGGNVTSFPDQLRVADRRVRAPTQVTGAYGLRLARTR